jgi:ATP-dependent Clp protease adapter protein ClpS
MRTIGFGNREEVLDSEEEMGNASSLQGMEIGSPPKGWSPMEYPKKGYGIMLYNNDTSTLDDVVNTVCQSFMYPVPAGLFIAQYIHSKGFAFVGNVSSESKAIHIQNEFRKVGLMVNYFEGESKPSGKKKTKKET